MSCQSLAARAFAEPDKDAMTHCGALHRSVRFSSESRASTRSRDADAGDARRDGTGSASLSALPAAPPPIMSQSAPPAATTFDLADTPPPSLPCRFPKLEECAHFHYERVSLGGLRVRLAAKPESPDDGWVYLSVASHVLDGDGAGGGEWTLARSREHFLQLDDMLHRCIYDRKVSGLPNLATSSADSPEDYARLITDYAHHLSMIADDSINCGSVLNWLQMDNKGHKLLVANEDSSSINTPAVAAAYSVRKYVSQARDEISFDVGDMISIIDMPGPAESLWWRGKRGFRVGFFPHHCVAVIGDKVPRHMTEPPPIVGSVAVAPIKPVLRKHGKLISLFRSFILSRPSRRSLKQQGILRERVFGCDLGEHLLNCGHEVPLVLVSCARFIESAGAVDGIYRLSGGSGLTQRLRAAFDAGSAPDLAAPAVARDPHAVSSLLKMYFRELPNPLCTYQLYEALVRGVAAAGEPARLRAVRDAVAKLPPPHYRTLSYLTRHLRRVSLLSASTGMTARNMAIVWAPNLLRAPRPQHALAGVAVQAVVTEFLICFAEDLFAGEQAEDDGTEIEEQDLSIEVRCESRTGSGPDAGRRPKSLPLHPPTKLLSLEEARRRGGAPASISPAPPSPGPPGVVDDTQLRPQGDAKPKYIEVGSGPNNLPQYHTVLDLPLPGAKRGLKRSPSGWRGLFSRSKLQRPRTARVERPVVSRPPPVGGDEVQESPVAGLRPVKSCESLSSDCDTLPPLMPTAPALRQHTRSSSCDSYFEPWQAELATMRLRLSPQERDKHMFSEEDDPLSQQVGLEDSLCSTPLTSAAASPRRPTESVVERKRTALEEQLASIGYIDGESPGRGGPGGSAGSGGPGGAKPPEKRHTRPSSPPRQDVAKRLCVDRDSPKSSQTDFAGSGLVKMRERNSPRKTKNTARYSGLHHPISSEVITRNDIMRHELASRLTWHGKDGQTVTQSKDHSTLIKIDWPAESSASNLTASTLNSSPMTPVTPVYDLLESDSEYSDANKHTIKVQTNCDSCAEEKCLKCELKATDYENVKYLETQFRDSLERLQSPDIAYRKLNRLSNISTSSNSEHSEKRKDSDDALKVMTSSHESSSSYSNASLKHDKTEEYESFAYKRPSYINLQSSSTSKSSPCSPLKSPLKSTISITFRSPTKVADYLPTDNMDTPTNDRDSVYEDIDLEKNLSIVEDATIPEADASLPTQQACQPNFNQDLIILETPTEQTDMENVDVYSRVKFFKKSIEEVNAMILESPEKERHYENVNFEKEYENVSINTLNCDKDIEISHVNEVVDNVESKDAVERDNGNTIKPKSNLNVRALAIRFESPTEQKGPFIFEKFKAEIKYPTLEKKEEDKIVAKKEPKVATASNAFNLTKNSCNARSLDENAFVKEFGGDKTYNDRRKSLDVRDVKMKSKYLPDLNLNMEETEKLLPEKLESITPTSENKISLIQRFDVKKPCDLKSLIGFEAEKKLSRERIEKYKEERRNFLREKYSSQSFRSNPEQLTRVKIKKDEKDDRHVDDTPQFERRNTVDLGQRMRFSLAKSANNLDSLPSPLTPEKPEGPRIGERGERRRTESAGRSRDLDSQNERRREKTSPSYNIRDMTAIFEQKSHGGAG